MKTKIALVENFGLDFLNFRVPLVKYLEKNNFEVFNIIPFDNYIDAVKETGVKVLGYSLKKNTLNPVQLLTAIKQILRYQKMYGFCLVHSFRLQPNIICSLAFALNSRVKLINHITGLGFAFSGTSYSSFFYKYLILALYQLSCCFSKKMIVQNSTDMQIFSRMAFASGKLVLIEGSGIDVQKFCNESVDNEIVNVLKEKISWYPGDIIVTFTGRLLKEKGIFEFLESARRLTGKKNNYKFIIAGWFDFNNPSCILQDQLKKHLINDRIIYLGGINEVRELLYLTDIFVLPTYREGFPRSVLEAMAMGVAVITTDVPGARESIIDDYNGLIVPVKNIELLMQAIVFLSSDELLRKRFGENGRLLAEKKYNSILIYKKIIDVYKSIL